MNAKEKEIAEKIERRLNDNPKGYCYGVNVTILKDKIKIRNVV
jgi:hypothetical protein